MNPKDVNKLNSKGNTVTKIYKLCPLCNELKYVSNYVSKCPNCKTFLESCPQPAQPNKPHCPTCNSTNVHKISDLRRGVHAAMWGLLSTTAKCQYECKNCGYKF